ncbi:hypothetical protein GGR50DRAFT_665283 [Xylaria sp. CBS 124048]|nr:hypothetical protein GGR50DRAFT_665283 [Xylaria sp. CBS 124048]
MAQEKMTLADWLDDLCVRFIINLPREDLSSVERICFQIEEAQWFYEDFIRPLDPALPSMQLRTFSLKMFQHCPLLASFSADAHLTAFEAFMHYKTRVPVRGAIMLNDAMDSAVLVRGYKKGAGWSFPRGKINKDEDDVDCAVREVYEETGYDLRSAGLIERNAPVHHLDVTMHDQQVRLYVFRGVSEETVFETRTRKEIGDIRWYNLSDLPAYKKKKGAGKIPGPATTSSQDKFYMVAPFMAQLRQWILKQKKLEAENIPAHAGHKHPPAFYDDNATDDNAANESLPYASARKLPENIDIATKELQQLLRIQPPTHGLQLPSPTLNQEPGHALLSILQPKMTNDRDLSNQVNDQSHAQRDQESVHLPQASTRGPHHKVQAIPNSDYSDFKTGHGHSSQQQYSEQYSEHRPRPKVYIDNEVPRNPNLRKPLHETPNPPVQLLHPQPLPPQVQKKMLLHNLHDMVSTPNATGATHQPGPTSMPQDFHTVPPNAQHVPFGPQGIDSRAHHPPQLGPHSTNLLNVLKGKNLPTSAMQQSASTLRPSPLGGTTRPPTEGQYQGQRIPAPQAGYADQYGPTTMPPTAFPGNTVLAPAPFSRVNARPVVPTDQHRVSLLGMFKATPSTISQNQIDGQGTSSPQAATPGVNETDSPKQQRTRHGLSTTDNSKVTARESGQPAQWNPQMNLPYGAQYLLRRDSKQGSAHSPALSIRNSNEATTNLPVRSLPSPTSSRGRMSPRRQMSPRSQMSPYQNYLQAKVQSPKPAAPPVQLHTASSYPYSAGQVGGAVEHRAQFTETSAASTHPAPGMAMPRQHSTIEHKRTLLSILGKPPPESERAKSKEPVEYEQMPGPGPASATRSRLASFASQGSRRGSAAPLSAADRNFLLDFLENASSNTKS